MTQSFEQSPSMAPEENSPKLHPRMLRFSLRSMLVVMVAAAISLGFLGNEIARVRRQRSAVAAIESTGGHCLLDFEWTGRWGQEPAKPRSSLIFQALIGPDAFAHVRYVHIRRDDDSAISAADLDNLKAFPRLTTLDLSRTELNDATLAHVRSLTSLTSLDLSDIRRPSVRRPQRSQPPLLDYFGLKLYEVEYGASITDAGLAHLKYLTKLEDLDLSGNTQFTDPGLIHLAQLPNLKSLGLNGTRIGDAGLVHLKNAVDMQILVLNQTRISDTGLMHLTKLKKLRWLELTRNNVTDSGLVHLEAMTNLKVLHIDRTWITDDGMAQLQEALPNCQLNPTFSGPGN